MIDDLQGLAARMLAEYDSRTPGQLIGEPFDLSTAQAYALQPEIARLREQRGEKVIGYKVGCTSRPIQAQLRFNEPIFGRLFDTVSAEAQTRCSGVATFAHSLSIRTNEVVVAGVEDSASLTCSIESLRWLAGRIAPFGLQLCKGQVILTGSPMKFYPVAPGSRVVVEATPLGASCVEIDR